ncbi:DUF6883 domain-containing protein [uncultured Thiohalocapsa sp.]|uniref:DUF6883 domain-containing protein n=1 Tax=uncultured Thiohalocapsa sp. TaxID=768990 RepID=UPI00345DA1FC
MPESSPPTRAPQGTRVRGGAWQIGPIRAREAAWLCTACLRAAREQPAVAGLADAHGRRYHVGLEVIGPRGTAPVRTTWIIRTGETAPRLTSCFVL